MVIPDWLYKLFAAIGLVDSEEKKIKKMIAGYKDELRRLRSVLEEQISEIEAIEREIRKLQPKYEEAQGPAKGAYAEIIKPLLQKRNSMTEQQQVISANIKAVTAMLAKAEILQKAPADNDRTAQIENMTMQMQDLGDVLKEQEQSLKELERAGFKKTDEAPLDLGESETVSDAELEKELAAFCGGSTEAPQENEAEKSEA